MYKKSLYFPVLFFICIIVFFIPNASQVLGDESEAVSKISQAEDNIETTYLSVLEAERAGGDVSELVSVLNTAIEYYSEAERIMKAGEYEAAIHLAEVSIATSDVVLNADISLIVVAKHVEETTFRNQFFLSFGAVFFIILFGFLGWRLFKGYYIHRVMELNLEVVADES